jgi:hypothetical protein
MDNIFVERLWRSLKYEEVYLNAYASVSNGKEPGPRIGIQSGPLSGVGSGLSR